jgi:hypothetical protein
MPTMMLCVTTTKNKKSDMKTTIINAQIKPELKNEMADYRQFHPVPTLERGNEMIP